MKRTALTIVSLASLAAMGSAHAQSSVTLYGLIDTSLTYVNHADGSKNSWLLGNSSAGNLAGSRWGIKGTEDLGSGLKAIFQLENGFDPSTGKLGQGSREFGRQAFVGLASDRLGTVTLGRQYDPLIDLIQPITADNYFGSAFATAGDVDNYDNSFRVDNAVKYTSPVFGGVQFEAMYSFGGVAGTTSAGQSYSAAVAYNGGPLSLAGGYYHATNSASDLGPRDSWSSSSDGTFDGPINLGYRTAHSLGIARVAGQYVFGKFTVGAGYSNAQYRRDGASLFGENEHYDTAQGFVNYQASPSILMGVGYSYTKSGGDSSATYHQVSLGGIYSLSKRTALYVIAAYQHASGTTSDGAGGTAAAQASIGSYGYAGTNTQTIVNLGIRHTF
jgi:predicted porin